MLFLILLRVILVITVVFVERKKPEEALLWVLVFAVEPITGLLLYVVFGSTIGIKIAYAQRNRRLNEYHRQVLAGHLAELKDRIPDHTVSAQHYENAHFNLVYNESLLLRSNRAQVLTCGQEKYRLMLADIEQAQSSIHVAYYSIHKDHVGRQFVKALAKKARQGVEVRVLYDGVGSLFTPRRMFRELIRAGGSVRKIKPLMTHFRYHRKIVVIDGKVGYTGGMNIGRKYLGELKGKSPWRDTQIRCEGDLVFMLQYYFLYDWLYANPVNRHGIDEEVLGKMFAQPEVLGELPCQVVGSGIEQERQTIKLSYLKMISSAKKSILFQTPYFIPDDSVLDALYVALASGIEVTIMVPGQRSSFFLEPVTRQYLSRLIPLGAKVYRYNGYIHAKTVRVDESITCIGTVNIDIRSLEIDDELCVIFYSEAFAQEFDRLVDTDILNSTEMDYEQFLRRSWGQRMLEQFFMLFSPLM